MTHTAPLKDVTTEQWEAACLDLEEQIGKIAGHYWGKRPHLDIEDLRQEGRLGVYRALQSYDPEHEKGASLKTYASFWIDQRISTFCHENATDVRIPVRHVHAWAAAMRKGEEYKGPAIPSMVAFDADGDGEDRRSMKETVANSLCLFAELEAAEERAFICEDFLKGLPLRTRGMVEHYFGLENFEAHTLEQVGQRYGLTRERVRQLIANAIKRFRRALAKRSS